MIQKLDTYFQQKLLEYGNELIRISRDELANQGHRVTGETERSFKAELKVIGVYHYELTILVKTSAIILNYGVEAKRVPYTPSKPRASVSKYIQALLNWAALIKPQLSDKERKSFVFAVAKKASKQGHPTSGSYAFSKNGRRKDWISFGISMNENLIKTIINPDNIYNILTNSIRA